MKNLWPDSFAEAATTSAKDILQEQAKLLSKLTQGIVYAEVKKLNYAQIDLLPSTLRDDFVYRFYIKGKFLPEYSFTVFTFSHDIALYPVTLRLDDSIREELGLKSFLTKPKSREELEGLILAVFTSERIKNVIGGILRLSK